MTASRALSEGRRLINSAQMRRIQQIWLALIFLLGLGYIVLVPPFQAIDEVAHWDRIWTVARGQYNCKTLPWSAAQFVDLTFRFDVGSKQGPVPWSLFREAYEHVGGPGEFMIATNGCHYPPVGYVAPALTARIVAGDPMEPAPHKMFRAFYGARLTNWLLFFVCLVVAHRVSLFPMTPLVFASIPMVLHQAMSINNDALTFGAAIVIGALLTRELTRARAWTVVALITLVSAIKPIHVIAATLFWIGLWCRGAAQRMSRKELAALVVASVALPVGAWEIWNLTMHTPILGLTTGMPVPNVDEAMQLALIKTDPLRAVRMMGWQLSQFFDNSPINGHWKGFLLTLGWYRLEAPAHVYELVIGTLAIGLLLLRFDAREAVDSRPVPWWLAATAFGAMLAYAFVVTLILYLAFTPVGEQLVFGVQGRYFLYPIALLLFLFAMLARRPTWLRGTPANVVACAFLALSIAGHVVSLLAIRNVFWQPS